MATFGNTAIKAGLNTGASGLIWAVKYALAEEGQITSISVYLGAVAGDIRHAIYSDNAGAPDALQCETNPATAAVGWNTINTITNPTLPPGNYWIATQVSSDTSEQRDQAGTTNQMAGASHAWGAFPDPFGTPYSYGDYDFSYYSTYTPSPEEGFAHVF